MNCFDRVAMCCTIYMMNCNSIVHVTCPLTLVAYKYNELQMSSTTQKLSCKASCKTPLFLIIYVVIESIRFWALGQNSQCGQCVYSYENMTWVHMSLFSLKPP